MPRYFIQFSYDGSAYHGWQIQPGAVSVQETMTDIFSRLFGPGLELTAAGRTDAGVHASAMTAHFDVEDLKESPEALVKRLNAMLPDDIAVQEIYPVRDDAHARFSAISRSYEYTFLLKKDPFGRHYAPLLTSCPDVEAMNEACRLLMTYEDFTSFSKLHTDVKTNICHLSRARWERRGDRLVFEVSSDRFLRNMVRALVGTLLEVGRHKLDLDGLRRIVEQKDRCAAGTSAPACGLSLTEVRYPVNIRIHLT